MPKISGVPRGTERVRVASLAQPRPTYHHHGVTSPTKSHTISLAPRGSAGTISHCRLPCSASWHPHISTYREGIHLLCL